MYQRLTTLAGADPGRLQLIIADNELPGTYRSCHPEILFDYDHPGLNGVTTIEFADDLTSE